MRPEKIIIEKRDVEEEQEEKVVKDETLTKEEQEAIERARLEEPEKFDAVEEIIESHEQDEFVLEDVDADKENKAE